MIIKVRNVNFTRKALDSLSETMYLYQYSCRNGARLERRGSRYLKVTRDEEDHGRRGRRPAA